MIKIGIELNGVVRDLNKQILKYYLKDIDPNLEEIDLNTTEIVSKLPFKTKKDRENFLYEDYPYEIYGCAAPMSNNLHNYINGWAYNIYHDGGFDDLSFFSLKEDELTIQSTYFYLSKSGSRVRNVNFPRNASDVWDLYDVVITTNREIVASTPHNKISVLIKKNDTEKYENLSDYVYNNLEELLRDKNFIPFILNQKKFNSNILKMMLYKTKRLLKRLKNIF